MLIARQYELIIDILWFCLLPIIYEVNNRLQNTKSTKGALSLFGNSSNFFSSVKDRFIPPLCSRSTLPPVLDDITNLLVIAVLFYNYGRDGTRVLETTPKTCPMVNVNCETRDGVIKDPM